VLHDHPVPVGGATGPEIPVTAATLSAYQSGSANGEPEVTVAAGETVTELDALEGLLVNSGTDMATLLADWDAGSTPAFVDRMNRTAHLLGMRHTHITDPSGADSSTVATAGDLLLLGEAAMRIPVLSQIVSLGETALPLTGVRYNPNFELGQDGIVGIMASSNTAVNGCFLFAATKTTDGLTATLYGAVLGQSGPQGPDTAAVDVGAALVRAGLGAMNPVTVLPAGKVVGKVSAPWGASVPVTMSSPASVLAWPGLTASITVRAARLPTSVAAGSVAGVLHLREGSQVSTAFLKTTAPLAGPTAGWRLLR
jgi:D-alanyl-D-alanine carboxypeptidase